MGFGFPSDPLPKQAKILVRNGIFPSHVGLLNENSERPRGILIGAWNVLVACSKDTNWSSIGKSAVRVANSLFCSDTDDFACIAKL